jgi:excisionase family DNA binding protein
VGDAAGVMGASREYVRRLCRAGVLPARRVGRPWLITIPRERLTDEQDH